MTLRVGLLGTGFGKTHGNILHAMDGVELVALCNRSLDGPNTYRKELNSNANIYDDVDVMLANETLDALYICLPPFAHNGEVQKAAAKGIHLFLEKPIALNSIEAKSMVDAIEQAGVKSQVGFHMRFSKTAQTLHNLIKAGKCGQPVQFTARYWANMLAAPWWQDHARSGGQIYEQVIHLYDLAMFLFGDVADAQGILSNLCHNNTPDYTIEDNSIGVLNFANGASGVITGNNCAVKSHWIGDFRAVFENLSVDYRSHGQSWVDPDQATIYLNAEDKQLIVEDADPYEAQTKDFINAIREDRPALTPVQHGLRAIEVIERVREAAQQKGAIHV